MHRKRSASVEPCIRDFEQTVTNLVVPMEVNADSTSLDALRSRDLFKDPDFGSSDTLNNVGYSL